MKGYLWGGKRRIGHGGTVGVEVGYDEYSIIITSRY
ncbi:putative 4-amino-4-deoxy-L-arabinose-phosphoundecaprenol flippase subunit ArnF [Yersinia pseudotuberculosis]|nr:putative 4-amino-4-deoxy-L-arabinose-phosphoundecaprenol flippase subunit ArnF [Yersinia pseudotuberculosis]